jgi:hypothetical protein
VRNKSSQGIALRVLGIALGVLPQLPKDDPFWQMMEGIWAAQKARGHVPRTKAEIDAEVRVLRDEAEEERS